ncbi:protein-glutamate methylesterase/protein-glutamine glutaminase [Clostridium formicaceticum]|uniref:Protein-glutamate methylesterase/protein-glutamine glutaminase n=1 Tax=Clostridium formicaceticum TaxID=1497 RepID=A0AAC9RR69_9CLOT|nr:chemotaxis response regulator protein-glutamate methylesterase [Clostridium formicaceticum]AOY74955.1 chemotaxis response regulator protein-glutamate methylesterase [Clostridium formicaceticum]ARE89363.1 Chemotaxis response regulator protein-glutamate methylesterase [Clostridium formicaceticum]
MRHKKRIKVLIVDDSIMSREILSRGISSDPSIEVVATATDPFDARDKILKYKPDVMTCDVEMPKMNGIEFIRRLLPQYPLPTIVVSTVSQAVFDAMKVGAVDFVSKPDMRIAKNVEKFINELIEKIITAADAKILQPENAVIGHGSQTKEVDVKKVIAIGASTGGTEAIYHLLKSFPEKMPGIVIVQHIPPVFSRMFAERLNNTIALSVKEAQSGDYITEGKVFIAPGDQHMRIKKVAGRYKIECFKDEKVNGHCPSVDILFKSVAKEAGSLGIGIILTGMGYDGAQGLLAMRRKGARTIGQDAPSSVVYGMPKVAFDIGAVEKQMSLLKMPQYIYSLID